MLRSLKILLSKFSCYLRLFYSPFTIMKMKRRNLVLFFLLFAAISFELKSSNNDSINYEVSLILCKDLSDTYGGGSIFLGEVKFSKSWYRINLNYGFFQSQSTFLFTVPYEKSGYLIEIPFDEMAIMKIGTFSFGISPINKNRFDVELNCGLAYGRAEWSCFRSVEYSFDIVRNEFTYLSKNYQLIKSNHFGYQIGLLVTYFPLIKVGIQIDARIYDLNNGGTFFLVGGGLCFKF